MVFSSVTFLMFFLPLVLVLYYSLSGLKWKNSILLLFSLLFYSWGEPLCVLLMIFSICINYIFALCIANQRNSGRNCLKKVLLIFCVIANLSILFYFKYFNFAMRILHVNIIKEVVLPIGISFYTFQILSYVVDVYRNPLCVQKNILDLGLYISFFPQLIAGPIVRYHDIDSQIRNRKVSLESFTDGVKRFVIGLGKKVLLANTFAVYADTVLNLNSNEYSVLYAWGGCYHTRFKYISIFQGTLTWQ